LPVGPGVADRYLRDDKAVRAGGLALGVQ
jgi:hypothetical protein